MSRAASARRLCPAAVPCVLAVLAWTSGARGDEHRAVAARVHVDAPVGCASDASFWRATSRRTDRLRAVEAGAAEASLEVTIQPGERGATGELRIHRGGTRSADRKVRGASCDEVTQALSLIAALAFDPAARADMPEEMPTASLPETGAAEGAPPAAAPGPPASPVPAAAPAPPPPAGAAPGVPVGGDRPAGPARAGPPARWRIGAGAHAGALGLASPGVVVAYGAFLELGRDAQRFSPSFRAGAMLAEGTASTGGVDAELTWTLARGSLCPVRFELLSGVSLRPCVGADVGALAARAPRLERSQDRTRAWVAPTAMARLVWSPVRVLFLEIEGGVAVPLVRDEIAVDPSISLYRAPSVLPTVQVGAGMRFP